MNKTSNYLESSSVSSQSAIEKILKVLKTEGPKTAGSLAQVLGMTGEGARLHLLKLAEEGLVQATSEAKGVGRPTLNWSLTAAGNARFPNTHDNLSVQLLNTIKAELGEQVLEQIIDRRGEEVFSRYAEALKDCHSLEEKINRFATIRHQEGYIASWQKDEFGYLLVENHCPICAAATANPVICRSELRILKQVLGSEVEVKRVDHILEGARRCAYRITLVL
ncbi:MarR family transcriptional regulator [Adhaeribacter arboris]|uniref:MarR family transcriptional regulator n=1 Tax=Adhaeribacter arboris TaxID=2072846 RepID=A0A2T2YDY0_9BACT|nr:metalloregulator ArsR/SmtB family transcription factor [Adhaeribacter arboris]PSR53711.1 MarR family transcriptional regulator [Adhaeribacter arboris]